MVVRRNFNPGKLSSANVKQSLSGTKRSNQVARRDLEYWLPRTAPLLDDGVTPVNKLYDYTKIKLFPFMKNDDLML